MNYRARAGGAVRILWSPDSTGRFFQSIYNHQKSINLGDFYIAK